MRDLNFNIEDLHIPYTLLETDELINSINNITDRKLYFLCDQELVNLPVFKKIISKVINIEAIYFICATETNKTLNTISEISEFFIEKGIDRKSLLLVIGGGTVGNIGGMVASLLFRGIDFIHIPTTFLAMSDSVFSLKQAVNTKFGKNQLGLFAVPQKILMNYEFIDKQDKVVVDGLYELVKNILIISPEYYADLKDTLTSKVFDRDKFYLLLEMCRYSKEKVMSGDKFEKNRALVLEYGHTIGHAIETFSKGEISHGNAVGIGMRIAAEVSYELGFLSEDIKNKHNDLINSIGNLEHTFSNEDIDSIVDIMKKDNKKGYLNTKSDTIDLVLIENLGKPLFTENIPLFPVRINLIRKVLTKLLLVKKGEI